VAFFEFTKDGKIEIFTNGDLVVLGGLLQMGQAYYARLPAFDPRKPMEVVPPPPPPEASPEAMAKIQAITEEAIADLKSSQEEPKTPPGESL
jgi:hypothetical protein